jgi:histidine triad (HIT) family protein
MPHALHHPTSPIQDSMPHASPGPMNEPCVFCEILAGRVPASVVYEDALTAAFVDLRQANPGHLLVVPRAHLADVRELDDRTGTALMATVVRVTRAVAQAFPNEGLSLWHSIGPAAFQEVPHLHVHVHPRRHHDQLLQVYPSEPGNAPRAEVEAYAERLRPWLDAPEAPPPALDLVSVLVPTYDAGRAFFVNVLGFTVAEDRPALTTDGRAKRWLVVRPAGGGTGFVLAQADGDAQQSAIGQQWAGRVGLFLRVHDFDGTLARIRAAGLTVEGAPRHEAYGRVVVFHDPFGNRWDLLGSGADQTVDRGPGPPIRS